MNFERIWRICLPSETKKTYYQQYQNTSKIEELEKRLRNLESSMLDSWPPACPACLPACLSHARRCHVNRT